MNPKKQCQPRPYQLECIEALAEARVNGIKKGLVVMASGLGKTITACFDLQQFFSGHPNARVLYLCHQENILLQSRAKFQKIFSSERSYGMFTGNDRTEHTVDFLFATLQTMRDHREEFPKDAFDYIIVDEAHHTPANTYRPTVEYFQPQFLLGLTATKDRMDGQDLLDIYQQILFEMDIYDGWAQGWLAKVDYRLMLDDLRQEEFAKYVSQAGVEKVSLTQLNKSIFAPQHDQDIVKSIREQTADLSSPSMFVFCPNIAHAMEMAYHFGGEAAVVHSRQSFSANEAILESFRAGDIRILISVNMLNEGIDIPETDVVVFLRLTDSLAVYFQQLGRGLRLADQKRSVRVLDYVFNLERIAMVLEMEESAKKRIVASPNYSPSADKLDPLVVNIPATKFKVERVDIELLLAKIKVNRSWSDEELMEAYLAKCNELGHAPSMADINADSRMASSVTYIQRFHGLKTLAEHFGYDPNGNFFISREEIIKKLWRKAEQLGRTLTLDDIKNDPNMPGVTVIYARFKNWNEALSSIGQKSCIRRLSKEEVIRRLQNKARDGKMPLTAEIDADESLPCSETIRKMFGGLEGAARAAGLEYRPKSEKLRSGNLSQMRNMTNEELKQGLRRLYTELGHEPSKGEINACEWLPKYSTCRRRFGSAQQMREQYLN